MAAIIICSLIFLVMVIAVTVYCVRWVELSGLYHNLCPKLKLWVNFFIENTLYSYLIYNGQHLIGFLYGSYHITNCVTSMRKFKIGGYFGITSSVYLFVLIPVLSIIFLCLNGMSSYLVALLFSTRRLGVSCKGMDCLLWSIVSFVSITHIYLVFTSA